MLTSNALPRDLYPYVEEPKGDEAPAEKAQEAQKVASLVKSARTKGWVQPRVLTVPGPLSSLRAG